MTNEALADNFLLLSKLMEIHGDNPFKIKSYSFAARTIDKYPVQLATLTTEQLLAISSIGKAIGEKILQQLQTGAFPLLEEYLRRTPPGIIEMLHIKGLGPKKIAAIWKDLQIETIGELQYACEENRLTLYKGFGEKTQQNIYNAILFYQQSKGQYLYAEIEPLALKWQNILEQQLPDYHFLPIGAFPEHQIVIQHLDWVTDAPYSVLNSFAEKRGWKEKDKQPDKATFATAENTLLQFILADKDRLYQEQFRHTGSTVFLEKWNTEFPDVLEKNTIISEAAIFAQAGMEYIPPYLRESPSIIAEAEQKQLPQVIQPSDIKGIVHCHSNWSDGVNTLEEMALAAKSQGLQYLVISDHSQTAVYANGLKPDRIRQQHAEIDALNAKLAPFKIFKSIESDILNDGQLDYPDEILDSFDLVIASVHSNLRMTEEKAMARLLTAIANPYTSILGHMTGRLLLSRPGYPVDHEKIIAACAAHNVVIELNAHPRRLDMDWQYIGAALAKNVLISIDPDAHRIEGFKDVRFGVLAAQKAGLTATQNLSSHSLEDMEKIIAAQKAKRNKEMQ